MTDDVRWKQRFENFARAFVLLRSGLDGRRLDSFNELELEEAYLLLKGQAVAS